MLKKTPADRQVALFSATMPPPIKRIAQTYLRDPVEVTIKPRPPPPTNIRQRYWLVSGMHKLDALTRILEAEDLRRDDRVRAHQARHRGTGREAAARGFSAAAINGDMDRSRSASAPSSSSRTASSTSWSPPTWPRAAWTWSASATC
jgi:ATP-dependent RNA helicase DeaD